MIRKTTEVPCALNEDELEAVVAGTETGRIDTILDFDPPAGTVPPRSRTRSAGANALAIDTATNTSPYRWGIRPGPVCASSLRAERSNPGLVPGFPCRLSPVGSDGDDGLPRSDPPTWDNPF